MVKGGPLKKHNKNIFLASAGTLIIISLLGAAAEHTAYRGTMAIRDAILPDRGIAVAARDASRISHALQTLRVTPSAEKAYYFTDEVIRNVDFGRVMTSDLSFESKNKARGFTLSGQSIGDEYLVNYHRAPLTTLKMIHFFDFAIQANVAEHSNPMPDEKLGYLVSLDALALSGDLSHREVLRLAGGVLKVLDPVNLQSLETIPKSPFKSFTKINRQAFDEFLVTLPALTSFILRYAQLEPHITIKSENGQNYTDFAIDLKLKLDTLTTDFPVFGAYIENLVDNFDFKANLIYQLKGGLRLGVMGIDSQTRSISIAFKTRDGAILPWAGDKTVHFDKALAIADMKQHDGLVEGAFKGKAKGIAIDASGIMIATEYKDAAIAHMQAKLVKFPKPSITGMALGFIPIWAIDFSIPGSLDGYASKLTQTLLKANGGVGTSLLVDIDTRQPGNTLLRGHFESELLDNFFLEFGLSIVQSYIWPDVEVIKDGFQFVKAGVQKVEKDLVRLTVQT